MQELVSQEDVTHSILDESFNQRIDSLQNNHDDVTHIVQFAQTTVQNLKQILEKKNDLVQRYQERFMSSKENVGYTKDLRTEKYFESRVTDYDENLIEIEKMKYELSESSKQTNKKDVYDQLGEASDLINAKEALIDQLQFSLRSAEEYKDDAEKKCQMTMHEIEKMKMDMVTMAKHMKDGVFISTDEDFEPIKTFGSLQEEIEWKDEKIKRLTNSIEKLKCAKRKKKPRQSNNGDSSSKTSNKAVEDLDKANEKVISLNDDLNKLKREISSMRSQKRKLQLSLEESNSKENAALVSASSCEKELKTTRQALKEISSEKEKMSTQMKHIKNKLKNIEHSDDLKKKESEILKLKERISSLVKQNTLLRATIAQKKLKSEKDAINRDITKSKKDDGSSNNTEVLKRVKNLEKQLENDKQTEKKKGYSTLELQRKEISILRQQLSDYKAELDCAKRENKELVKKVHVQEASNTNVTEIKKLKEEICVLSNKANEKDIFDVHQQDIAQVEELKKVVIDLKRNLAMVKNENERIHRELKETKLPNNNVMQLKKEIFDLRAENSRLFQDLQAFDLKFFEEIEDLKFKVS